MDFISNSKTQVELMLKDIGIESIQELFREVPSHLILPFPEVDDGVSEMEGLNHLKKLAKKNRSIEFDSYLGGGAYDHYVPAIVSAITSKSEFLTSYTPYQAECSQGMLQAIFEFQTVISQLTGLDIANASMYDAASACAESLMMAINHFQGEKRQLQISSKINPHYREVIELYLKWQDVTLTYFETEPEVTDQTAAVLYQYPNYFGVIEEVKKPQGPLLILCVNPLAIALFKTPGEFLADIAVGDGQPLGLPLNFGGPYVGFIACKKELIRQLPGRIVGQTTDLNGNLGYVLTLQTREQHIRREKATSNICTNQALQSLAMLVTTLWYGKKGLRELALANFQRANYLKSKLESHPQVIPFSKGTVFNEFAIGFKKPLKELLPKFYESKILPGIQVLTNHLLISVTETKSLEQLQKFINVLVSS